MASRIVEHITINTKRVESFLTLPFFALVVKKYINSGSHMRLHLVFVVIWACFMTTPVFAQENEDGKTKITVKFGIEFLKYDEHLPENYLASNATLSNLIASAELIKRWNYFLIGIQGVIPIKSFDDQEEWLQNNHVTQTNQLKYRKTQFSSFVGFPLSSLFSPILGLRAHWSKQQRFDFREHDGSLVPSPQITEKVIAYYSLLGFIGRIHLSKKWAISYGAEYNLPFYSKVTNNGLPNWETTNINGYMWNGYSELSYEVNKTLTIGLLLSAGQQHWDGSNWQIYNMGLVKWPENNTYFISSFLSCIWEF